MFSSSHSPADSTSVSDDCPSLLRTGFFLDPSTSDHSLTDLNAHCHALAQVR